MPSRTAVRSDHAACPTPAPCLLSHAPCIALPDPELPELAFDRVVLNRLDAIFQSVQSTSGLDQTVLDRLDAIFQSVQSAPDLSRAVLDRLDAIFRSVKAAPDLDLNLDQAIRLPVVLDLAGGVSKSTWYALLNPRSKTFDPRAPQPFKLGPSPNSPSVWWRSAVMAYLKACASPQAGV